MAAQKAKPQNRGTVKRRPRARLSDDTKERINSLAQDNPNLSHQEIATLENVGRSTVTKVLANYGIQQSKVEDFRDNRADIFAGLQERIVSSVTDEEIKKAPIQVKMMALGVIYDKERLERGQSTENIGLITKVIRELRDRDE